jgi:S1-C subfamily serine protease
MSTIHDPLMTTDPGQAPPGQWQGPGGPWYPASPPGRSRRPLRYTLAAVAVVAAAAGALVGVRAGGSGTSGSGTLTRAQIAARVAPGLVDVVSTMGYQGAKGAGTGMVLTSTGEVLTNNHVVEGATSIRVTDVGNGRTYAATVVGYDRSHDVAVLQLRGASGLATVTTGNSAQVHEAERVVALGNALGRGGTPSEVTGRVTGLDASVTATDQGNGTSERLTGLIAHDAPIRPGDSGGPLVNTAGQVIGMDTAAGIGSGLGQAQTQAVAIPINEALLIAGKIEAGRASAAVHIGATAFIGVQIVPAARAAVGGVPVGAGAVVAGVLPGTPAAATAGLATGDVIDSVNGHQITSPGGLQSALEQHHPGDRVTIGWTDQAGQSHSAAVVLTTGPAG